MTGQLNVKRTALTVGSFAGLLHLMWFILVATGLAQGLVNWRLNMHFVSLQLTVLPFDVATATALVVLAFVGGSIVGAVLATLWNNFPE